MQKIIVILGTGKRRRGPPREWRAEGLNGGLNGGLKYKPDRRDQLFFADLYETYPYLSITPRLFNLMLFQK